MLTISSFIQKKNNLKVKKIIIVSLLVGTAFCTKAQVLNIKNGAIVSINHNDATPVLTINGSFTQEGSLTLLGTIQNGANVSLSGTLNVSIGGATLGTGYDQINSAGIVTISNATLNVSLVNGYVPTSGAIFTLIDGISLSGTFTTVNLPVLPSGMIWQQNYNNLAGTYDLMIATVLPVELVRFEGQATDNGNLLSWQTANEQNSKGFDLEKTTATTQIGSLSWQKIGFVPAKGKAASYQFFDKNPQLLTYYRLKQVDKDGSFSYSKIIAIENKAVFKRLGDIKIYPTVVSDVLMVERAKAIQIFNLSGQLVLSQQTEESSSVHLSEFPNGLYIIKAYPLGLEDKRSFKMEKIIKQ
jgi:Secretion system C-terminal sorting domain